MMAGNETTRRRRSQGRAVGASEASSTSRNGRSSTAPGHNEQPLHHHLHDHHHHHYHYHHHYHHFPRSLNNDQDQSLLVSSGSVAAPREAPSQPEANYGDQQWRQANSRSVFTNSSQVSMLSREPAREDRERLDERIRTAAMQSHRAGSRGNLLEEFSLLFEDDEEAWSDDELLEWGLQEWLAAVGFEEEVQADVHPVPEQGLSRALIRRLQKVVFVPRVPRGGGAGAASEPPEQDDCSVCLEHFVSGQQLICLPCKHRFHPDCLTPWLESHAKCPYCRAKVGVDSGAGAGGGAGAASSSQTSNGSAVSLIEDDLIAWMEGVDSELSQLSLR